MSLTPQTPSTRWDQAGARKPPFEVRQVGAAVFRWPGCLTVASLGWSGGPLQRARLILIADTMAPRAFVDFRA